MKLEVLLEEKGLISLLHLGTEFTGRVERLISVAPTRRRLILLLRLLILIRPQALT